MRPPWSARCIGALKAALVASVACCRSRGAAPHCRTIPPATKGTPRDQVAQPLPRRPSPLLHSYCLRLEASAQPPGDRDPVPGMGRRAPRSWRESAGICPYAGALPRSSLVRERRERSQVPAENPRADLPDFPAGPRVLPLRSEKVLNTKVDYLHANPVRRNLVADPGDWEHSSYRQLVLASPGAPFHCDDWDGISL